MNEVIKRKISRLEKDVLRYKEYLKKDLESNNLNDIESTLRSYSADILTTIKLIEELKEIQIKLK